MSHLQSTIGRGLVPVVVEYDADYDTDDNGRQHIDIDIQAVLADGRDVQDLLTESVFQSLEADCKAHERAEQIREAGEYSGDADTAKERALAHYSAMAQEVAA